MKRYVYLFLQPLARKSKFLHLTDVHLDLSYTLGNAASDCGTGICCQIDSGLANSTDQGQDFCECWCHFDYNLQI